MTSLHIRLEARSAEHHCFRAYEIDVGADLFGAWVVAMSYGRIGTTGRSKVRSYATLEGAQAQVHACLRNDRRRRVGLVSPTVCGASHDARTGVSRISPVGSACGFQR